MNGKNETHRTTKVLFVCHGNICRSPMAEFILKDKVRRAGLEDRFEIASAATSAEESGNPVYPPARRELQKHGLKCGGKTARRITRADYDDYDFIIGMEQYNLTNLRRIIGGDPEDKFKLLLSYAGQNRDIEDPWYSGNFALTYRDIAEGCEAFLNSVEKDM